MTIQAALTLLLLVTTSACLNFVFLQLRHSGRLIRAFNSRQIAAHSENQKIRMDASEVRNRAKLLEDTVSGSTSAVEKMHRLISNTTFSLVDHFSKDDDFRQSARKARTTHNQTSKRVYQTVRTTNKAVHILADTLFISRREKRVDARKHDRKDR